MKKIEYITLFFFLMIFLSYSYRGNFLPAKASPDIHQGDLVLTGNNITIINGRFDINGSIIVQENATLHLIDAVVNITQPLMGPYNITLKNPSNGNPRLIVSNSSLESNYGFSIHFYGNSTLLADELRAYKYVYFYDNSSAIINNSSPILFLRSDHSSNVQISGSEFVQMRCQGSSIVSIADSNVPNFVEISSNSNTSILDSAVGNMGNYASSKTEVSNCTIMNTYFQGGPSSIVSLVNSGIERFRAWGSGKIFISNCTTGSSTIYGSSEVSFSNCQNRGWLNASGSSTTTISDQYVVNGTITIEENATLALKNAELNFTQTEDWQHGITIENPAFGAPKLKVMNTTVVSNYRYSIKLYDNSSAIIHNSEFKTIIGSYCWLWTYDSAEAAIQQLKVHGFSSSSTSGIFILDSNIGTLNIYENCTTRILNSTVTTANSYGTANIVTNKSIIAALQAWENSQCTLLDSTVDSLRTYVNSTLHLVNSTYTSTSVHNQSKILVYWYLDVHVIDSIGQDVPSADVTATYKNTTAESEQTDTNGWTPITLIEEKINATGTYPTGNYTIEATYLIYSKSVIVNMTGNQQITIQLEEFVIPEFTMGILVILLTILSVATNVVKRRFYVRVE
ncbi:MAG: hypothetical protein PVH12_06370 [Candidatus Bathyarchaeota archaeon]